jgi:hypothetical protein
MTDITYPLPNGFENNLDARLTKYLAIIRANCGDPQPPMARKTSVNQIYGRKISGKEAANVHDDALEREFIVEWIDEEGDKWIGITREGFQQLPETRIYTRADVERLHKIAEIQYEREEANQKIVSWVNRWVEWIKSQEGHTGSSPEANSDDQGENR